MAAYLGIDDSTGARTTFGSYVPGLSDITFSYRTDGDTVVAKTKGITRTLLDGVVVSSFPSGEDWTDTYVNDNTPFEFVLHYGVVPASMTQGWHTLRHEGILFTFNFDTIAPYTPPNITAFSVARCTSDGTLADNGTYLKYALTGSVCSLPNNDMTVKLKYRASDSTATPSEITLPNSGTSYNSMGVALPTFDTGTEYTVWAEISDSVAAARAVRSLPKYTAFAILYFKSGGGTASSSVGIGAINSTMGTILLGMPTSLVSHGANSVPQLRNIALVTSTPTVTASNNGAIYGIYEV